jgi:hypothetical protein
MRTLRTLLIGTFSLLLALPGLQMRFHLVPEQALSGVTIEAMWPSPTLTGWWSGELQSSLEAWLDGHLGLRGHAVRTDNQIGLSIFGEASSKAADTPVLGRRMMVYEDGYLTAYNGSDPYGDRRLHKLARKLGRLQKLLAERGVAFVLVISPNKAAIYPEYLPVGFVHPDGLRPATAYQRMLPMLQREGVHVVDGHSIFEEEKARSHHALFPPGGVHWNRYGAYLVLRQTWQMLERQIGKPMLELRCGAVSEDREPLPEDPMEADQETDAAELLNVWHVGHGDWKFPRPELFTTGGDDALRPNLMIVGDSFWTLPASIIAIHRLAARSDFYYYFNEFKPRVVGQSVQEPTRQGAADQTMTWDRVLSADAVIIEVNEITIGEAGYGFVPKALHQLQLAPRDSPRAR